MVGHSDHRGPQRPDICRLCGQGERTVQGITGQLLFFEKKLQNKICSNITLDNYVLNIEKKIFVDKPFQNLV